MIITLKQQVSKLEREKKNIPWFFWSCLLQTHPLLPGFQHGSLGNTPCYISRLQQWWKKLLKRDEKSWLTSLSCQVQVPGACFHFDFVYFQLDGIFFANCCHNKQLPSIDTDPTTLHHIKKMSLHSNNMPHKTRLTLQFTVVYSASSHITSESTCAAAMHWSADSLLLNWAKAQPGEEKAWSEPVWVRKQGV